MKIEFVKMHGCGNDYIYIDCFKQKITDFEKLAVEMSDRHFGIGGDGIVCILPSDCADVRMRMFNADGSEGKMCGNAIRCVGKYVYDNNIVRKSMIAVETQSGIKALKLTVINDVCVGAQVSMGKAVFTPKKIPVLSDSNFINLFCCNTTAVSMGNPHCVIFREGVMDMDIKPLALDIQNCGIFPEGVNVEFCEITKEGKVNLRVYERGSGETLACGTGACATVAAAVINGLLPAEKDISVNLRGGELKIRCGKGYEMLMTGPATLVFEGTYEYKD